MIRSVNVAVLGATGAVGREFLDLFEKRNFRIGELRLLASARSAGETITYKDEPIVVQEVGPSSFEGIDVAFFSAGATRSKEWAPIATAAGAKVVDNSSAFRMDPEIPLVVPEVNWHAVKEKDMLIANPNCCTIILLMAVAPLRQLGSIKRLIVSTYQSASGGGAAMMQDLMDQTSDFLAGNPVVPKVTPHPYAFNIFSHNTAINSTGANEEEAKVIEESRKILSMPSLAMNVTCIRVPVLRAHCESVTVEFEGTAPSIEAVREVLNANEGVKVVDDRETNTFPMPSDSSGIDEILVGRLRQDPSNPNGICMFISGDQLLKGAALNAVQIAEKLFSPASVAV